MESNTIGLKPLKITDHSEYISEYKKSYLVTAKYASVLDLDNAHRNLIDIKLFMSDGNEIIIKNVYCNNGMRLYLRDFHMLEPNDKSIFREDLILVTEKKNLFAIQLASVFEIDRPYDENYSRCVQHCGLRLVDLWMLSSFERFIMNRKRKRLTKP
jgi:hypothetical protein